MARLANLNGVSETLPAFPKLPSFQRTQKRTLILGFHTNKSQEFQDQPLKITRRLAIGLASIAIFGNTGTGNVSLAEDNGLWLTGPIPIPPIYNSKFSHSPNFNLPFLTISLIILIAFDVFNSLVPMKR